ncbi:MAG: hypothetical protein R2847_07665 [Bacteroidia bacterium]
MLRSVLFFVFSALMMNASAQTFMVFKGDTINRKDSKGQKQGVWKKYYRNDQLFSETVFKDDKQTGTTSFYYESGKLKSQLNWKNPVCLHQQFLILKMERKCQRDFIKMKKDSTWRYYTPDEKLSAIENFKDGKRHGKWFTYYPEGGKVEEKTFVKDKLKRPYIKYFSDGKPMMTATYKDDKLTGKFVVYTVDGKPYNSGNYVKGERVGKWVLCDDKGNPWIESTYRNGFEVKTDTIKK